MAILNEIQKLSKNTVKNTEQVKTTSITQKKNTIEKHENNVNNIDKIEISQETKSFYNKINEAHNYLDDLKKTDTITEKETKEISNKIANDSYSSDSVTEKIVHSLLTLPAFNELIKPKENESILSNIQNKELEKIYSEIQKGNNPENIYDDVIDFIMRSLL